MKNYMIIGARVGVGEGGFACGPVDGPVVGEVELKEKNRKSFFVSLAEVAGIPNFYKTQESTFEKHIGAMESDDEEMDAFFEKLNEECFMETGDYDEIFEVKDRKWFDVLRYLIYIVRADEDEAKEFIKETTGKSIKEIEIPMSDIEEEYVDYGEDF